MTQTVFPASAQALAAFIPGPLVVDRNRTLIVGGSGPLLLARAKTGHVDKAEVVVIIPANQRTKLYLGADINCTGCAIDAGTRQVTSFDPALETWIVLACRGGNGSIVASFRQVAAADNTASTIVTAVVDLNAQSDRLVVTRDKPVASLSLAGLSLTGVSQTITSIVSVDGVVTTYGLSAPFVGTEVGNLVVGAPRTDRDLNGNLVATETKALSVRSGLVSLATWTRCWEAKKGLSPVSPGNVVSWTDQVSLSGTLVPGAAGHAQTTSDPSVAFAGTTQYLQRTSTPLSALNGDFAIYVRAKRTGGGTNGCAVDFGDGVSAKRVPIILHASGVNTDPYDGSLNPAMNDSFVLGTGYHDIFLTRVGTTWTLSVDARTPITISSAMTVAALDRIFVGSELVPGELNALTGNVAAVAYGVALSAGEKTAIRAYMATNYP